MEIKELFKTISRYSPIMQDIDTKLKAFVPDYIPAIGEVDAFLKMPRPDGKPESLGLNVVVKNVSNIGWAFFEHVRQGQNWIRHV